MWGRLNQIAQSVQGQFTEDEGQGRPVGSPTKDGDKTVGRLELQLEEAEERNRQINFEFKKLLKEKEKQIISLKETISEKDGFHGDSEDFHKDTKSPSKLLANTSSTLRRKVEEYDMLIEQKDQSINVLMEQLHEADDLKIKVEEQERKNTEKLMFELAGRITGHETIQRKLEEMKHVLEEKDNAVRNMGDQLVAQDDLLKSREESIKKLKRMAAGAEATEEMITTLQQAVQTKDKWISNMAEQLDNLETEKRLLQNQVSNRSELGTSKDQTIETLWNEIHQKDEMIRKLSSEKLEAASGLEKQSQEKRVKSELVQEKDQTINDLQFQLKQLEKELERHKDAFETSGKEYTSEVKHLKENLAECKETIKSKSQTIDMFQKELEDKNALNNDMTRKVTELQNMIDSSEVKIIELNNAIKIETEEKQTWKEKFETELSEKEIIKQQLNQLGHDLSQQLENEASKIERLKEEIKSSQALYDDLQSKHNELATKLDNCEENISEYETQLKKSKLELTEKQSQVENRSQESTDLTKQLENVKESLQNAEAETLSLVQELDKIDGERKKLTDTLMKTENEKSNLLEELNKSEGGESETKQLILKLKNENDVLNKSGHDMKEAMNQLISRLDTGESEMREVVQENAALNERLKQAANEKEKAEVRKTEIEIALDDFVKTTESRKRRSGRSSVENMEDGRSSSESPSGCNTPISLTGSPRNSSYLDVASSVESNFTSGNFGGKAFGDIFRLVEDERCGLEKKLDSVTKDRDKLFNQVGELGDYLEMEKVKFKQASDHLSQFKEDSEEQEKSYQQHVTVLEEEITILRHAKSEVESKYEEELSNAEELKAVNSSLESDLGKKGNSMQLLDAEINTSKKNVEQLQSELGHRKEQLEKMFKQNKQLKTKLNELQSNMTSKDQSIIEQNTRLEEIEDILIRSKQELLNFTDTINEKDVIISKQEQETVELKKIGEERERELEAIKTNSSSLDITLNMKAQIVDDLEETLNKVNTDMTQLQADFDQKERFYTERVESLRNDLSLKVTELQELNSHFMKNSEEALTERNSLLSRIKDMEESLCNKDGSFEQLLDTKNNEIQDLQKRVSELEVDVCDKKNELEEHEKEKEHLQSVVADNGRNIVQLNEKENSLLAELATYKNRIETIENELENKRNEMKHISEERAILDNSVSSLDQDLESSRLEIISAKQELGKQNEAYQEALGEIQSLKEKEINFQEILKERERELGLKEQEINQLKEYHSASIQEKQAISNNMSLIEEEHGLLKEQINEVMLQKADVNEKLELTVTREKELISLLVSKEEEFKYNEEQLELAQNEIVARDLKLNSSNVELMSRLSEKDENIFELHKEVEELQNCSQEQKKVIEEAGKQATDLQLLINAKDEQINSKTKEISQLQSDIKVKDEQVIVLHIDIVEKANELQKLKDSLFILEETKKEQIESGLHEIDQLQLHMKGRDQEIVILNDKITAKDTELQSLKDAVHFLEGAKKGLEEERNLAENLKSDVLDKDEKCLELQRLVSELKTNITESEINFNTERTRLVNVNEEISSTLTTLKETTTTQENDIALLTAHIDKNESELIKIGQENKYILDSYNNQISALKEEIDNKSKKIGEQEEQVSMLNNSVLEKESDLNRISQEMKEKLNDDDMQIKGLQQEVDNKTKTVVEYKAKAIKKLKSMKEDCAAARKKADLFDSKEEELTSLKATYESLFQDKDEMAATQRQRIIEMESLNQSRDENFQNVSMEASRISQLLNDKGEEVATAKDMLRNSMVELQELHSSVAKKDEKIKLLHDQILNYEEDLNTTVFEKERVIVELKENIIQLDDLCAAEKEENSKLRNSEVNLKNEIIALTKTKQEHDAVVAELRGNEKEKEFLTENISRLNSSLRELQAAYEYENTHSREQEDMLLRLENDIFELRDVVSKNDDEIRRFNDELQVLSNEKEQLLNILDKKEQKILEMTNVIEENDNGTEVNPNKLQSLEENAGNDIKRVIDPKGNEFAEVQQKSADIEDLINDERETLKNLRSGFEAEKEDLVGKLKELKFTNDTMKSSFDERETEFQTSVCQLNNKNEVLSQKCVELDDLINVERETLVKMKEGHEMERKDLIGRLNDLQATYEVLQASLEVKNKEYENLQKQLVGRSEEINQINSSLDQSINDAVIAYTEQVLTLQKSLDENKKTFDGYRGKAARKIRSVKEELAVDKAKIGELEAEVQGLNEIRNSYEFINQEKVHLDRIIEEMGAQLDTMRTDLQRKEEEQEDVNIGNTKLIQRLQDKDEELTAIKSMLQVSLNELQQVQFAASEKDESLQSLQGELLNQGKCFNSTINELNQTIDALQENLVSEEQEKELLKDSFSRQNVDNQESVNNQIEGFLADVERERIEKETFVEECRILNSSLKELQLTHHERESTILEFQDKLKDSVNEVALREQKLNSQESELRDLQNQLDNISKENSTLKLKLAKAIKRSQILKKEVQMKNDEIAEIEIAAPKGNLEIAQRSKEIVDTVGSDYVDDVDGVGEELSPVKIRSEEELEALSHEIRRKDELIKILENKIEKQQDEMMQQKSQLDLNLFGASESTSINIPNINTPSINTPLTKTNEMPVTQTECSEEKIRPIETEICLVANEAPLQAAMENDSTEDMVLVKQDLAHRETEIIALRTKIEKQQQNMEKAKKRLGLFKKAEVKLAEENRELQNKMLVVNETNDKLQSVIGSLKDEIQQAQTVKVKTEESNNELKTLVETLYREKQDLDEEMKGFSIDIRNIQDIKEGLGTEVEEIRRKLAEAEKDNAALKIAFDSKDVDLCKLAEEMNLKDDKIIEYNNKFEEVEMQNVHFKALIDEKDAELWKIEEHKNIKDDEFIELNNNLEEAERQNASFRTILDTKDAELWKIEEQLGLKDEEVIELENKLKNIQHVEETHDELLKSLKSEVSKRIETELNIEQLVERANKYEDLNEELLLEVKRLMDDDKIMDTAFNELNEKYQKLLEEKKTEEETKLRTEILETDRLALRNEIAELTNNNENLEDQLKILLRDKATLSEERDGIQLELQKKNEELDNLFQDFKGEIAKEREDARNIFENEKERVLNESLELAKAGFMKEKDALIEKASVEKQELLKMASNDSEIVNNLNKHFDEVKQHKDTVIAKLKIKLKHTIKDRDLIKENSQSEIERLSQEKDVIFNEFQTKLQQTESELVNIKSEHNECISLKGSFEKEIQMKSMEYDSMSSKLSEYQQQVDALEAQYDKAKKVHKDLKEKFKQLEENVEVKQEEIEKYEWENSEKVDFIRKLEKDIRSLQSNKTEFEEIRITLEDTIEVKENIIDKLQKEVLSIKEQAETDSEVREDVEELKMAVDQLEEKLSFTKNRENELNNEANDMKDLIREVSTIFGVNFDRETVISIREMKGQQDEQLKTAQYHLEDMKIETLKVSKEFEKTTIKTVQLQDELAKQLELFEQEKNVSKELQKTLDEIRTENSRLQDEPGQLLQQLQLEQNNIRELEEALAIQRNTYEEKYRVKSNQFTDLEHSRLRYEDRLEELENKADTVTEMVAARDAKILKLIKDKEGLQLENSMLESESELNKLEFSKLQIDYKNVNNQLSILLNEAQLLKSATVPEMEASISEKEYKISEKNKTILELRDNFDEVISQKDNVIDLLRIRITELHQKVQEEKSKTNIEINENVQDLIDKYNAVVSKKDSTIKQLQDKVKELNIKVNQVKSSGQNEMKLVSYAVVDKEASVKRLNDDLNLMANDVNVLKKQRDWLRRELSKVTEEKNLIGGSIQTQFESISGGLRGDIELAMEEKKNLESEYVIERLQLERQLAEHIEMVSDLSHMLNDKDEDLYEKQFVIGELKSRVEKAAEILSKEGYYKSLEEQYADAQEHVIQLIEEQRDVQNQIQEIKSDYDRLMANFVISEENNNNLTREVDANLQNAAVEKAEACQILRNEFEALLNEKEQFLNELRYRVIASQEEHLLAESKITDEYEQSRLALEEKCNSFSLQIEALAIEKEQLQKEAIDEVLKSRDERVVKLKADFDAMIDERDKNVEAIRQESLTWKDQCNLLKENNKNLSENAEKLKENNKSLEIRISQLEYDSNQLLNQQSAEIENIIIEKGRGFQELRLQFEEVLEEKTRVVEDLRKRIQDLNDANCSLNTVIYEKNSETKKLKLELIERGLELEQSKARTDSMANITANLESDIVLLKINIEELKDNLTKTKHELEELRTTISSYSQQKEADLEDVKITSSHMFDDTNEIEKNESKINDLITINPDLESRNSQAEESLSNEQDKSGLNKETLFLRNSRLDSEIREEFDDILKSLREDLHNALTDNRQLQEENFHLKGLDESHGNEHNLIKNLSDKLTNERLTIKTLEEELFNLKRTEMMPVLTERSSSVEVATQTDVEIEARSMLKIESEKLEIDRELLMGSGRIKRHGSSERLPEVVAETLYSPLNIDSLQAYSDTSSLEGETFLGSGSEYPKLELRLSEDQEDGEKSIGDLLNENENLKLKLEQAKKMIGKLKQISKKYRNDLNDTQSEKIEEIRGLEGVAATTRQELRLLNEERVRKDQELQSLREEVRSLVRDKETLLESFRGRSEKLNESFQSTITELKAESQSNLIDQQGKINVLALAQSELKENLILSERNVDLLDLEIIELRRHNDGLENQLEDQSCELLERSQCINSDRVRIVELTEKLQTTENENERLTECLSKPQRDQGTNNPGFDREILDSYEEELEKREDELEEAFDLIRRLEETSFQTEELYRNEKEEWNSTFNSLKGNNESLSSEKFHIEKSMQEMREEMEGILAKREDIVTHWKSKINFITTDNASKEAILQTESEQAIVQRDQQIALLNTNVEQLEFQLHEVSNLYQTSLQKTNELSNLNEEIEQFAANTKIELESALQERATMEDKLSFYQAQVEDYVRQKETEINSIKADMAATLSAYEVLTTEKRNMLRDMEGQQQEIANLKHEISRRSKMVKKLNKENERISKEKEELASRIRNEMETVVAGIHDERTKSYHNALEKEKALQELRIHSELMMREKDHWRFKAKRSDQVEFEGLQSSSIIELNSEQFTDDVRPTPDDEGLCLQIQQIQSEKDLIVKSLELIISDLKIELDILQKSKSLQDLEMIELRTRLQNAKQELQTNEATVTVTDQKYDAFVNVATNVKSIRNEFEELKEETQQMTIGATVALQQFQESLTLLVKHGGPPIQAELSTLSTNDEDPNVSIIKARLDDKNEQLVESNRTVKELEESLKSWKERCVELEDQLNQHIGLNSSGRNDSKEYLINIEDDDEPSIETARTGLGATFGRLIKYSTSGFGEESRSRSVLKKIFGRSRGVLPARRLLAIIYLIGIHVFALMSFYGFATA